MTKWEYLVFSTVYKARPNNNIEVLGYKLNDKKILFEVDSQFARDDVNYDKFHSNGQNQILNELGDEGWELIKIRGSGLTPEYFFKRPL